MLSKWEYLNFWLFSTKSFIFRRISQMTMLLECLAFSYFPGYGFIFSNIRLYGDLLVATRWYSWTVTHQQSWKFLTQEFVLVHDTSQKKSKRQKYDTPIFKYILTQTVFIFSICVLHNWIYLAPPLCCGFLNKFICGN